MTLECKKPSCSEIKSQLDKYRLEHLTPCEVELTLPTVVEKSAEKSDETPSRFIAILNLWYIQLTITFLLWIAAILIEFGAVFFVIASLYWLWVWGTTRNPKPRVSNNPDEQIISAGFFFDTSPIPSKGVF
ncbi:unnamed protein product [Trichobilharzia szidati]|nr:unnamed protein product [Trichobilharzia szidati]